MKKSWLTILIFITFPTIALCQFQLKHSLFERNTVLRIDSLQQSYTLPDSFLILNSESIFLDSLKLKQRFDYQIDYTTGQIFFFRSIQPGKKVTVFYKFLPLQIQRNYFHQKALF